MKNNQNKQWRNQQVFPLFFAIGILYGIFLKEPLIFLVPSYFLIAMLIKRQYVLLAIGVIVSGLFIMRMHQTKLVEVPEEVSLQTAIQVYPDTIQINGDLINFGGKMDAGKIRVRYQATSEEEVKQWQQRKNWHQKLLVQGKFQEQTGLRNKHGFDAQSYQFAQGELGTFVIEEIVSKREMTGFSLRELRAKAIDWMEENFSPKVTVYLWALLLGYRDQSFQEIREIFSGSGILHFFTISGMHVYLFYGWIFAVLRRMRLTFQEFSWLGLLLVMMGVGLFGQGISVLRAALSFLLSLWLREKQIHFSGMDRFCFVLFLLLLLDPKTLLQVSGILSLGISWFILMIPFIEGSWVAKLKQSQVIMCLTAPILMYYFFELSLLSGVLTTFCAPFFSLFLLPVGVSACLLKLLGFNFSMLNDLLLWGIELFEKGLNWTQPFVLITGRPMLFLVWLTVIISLLLYQSRRKVLIVLPIILLIASQRLTVPTAVSFVDVGQGDSIVFQSRFNKEVYVVDTGGQLQFERKAWQERTYRSGAEYTLIPFLKGEGVKQITGLFLTHGDADHLGDALRLIEEIPVEWIYVGKGSLQHPAIQKLVKQLPKQTQIREVTENEKIGQKIVMQVLGPAHSGAGENEDSLVLQTSIYGTHFLLTGDLDKAGEVNLLQRYPDLQADVVKLGHHGSRTSTESVFIERIKAKHGIISCGRNNRFKHPHSEVLTVLQEQQVKVLRTDQNGMVRYLWRNKQHLPAVWQAKQD